MRRSIHQFTLFAVCLCSASFRFLAIACVALNLISGMAFSQIGGSTITGRVTDATGAVVPGVAVLVVNTETNFQFTATTNQEGLYRLQSLQPGPYRITFTAAGFKKLVQENVDLRAGAGQAIDVSMEVGVLSEQVEVTAALPLLETQTSSTGTIAAGTYLYALPTFQRFTNATLNYVPGMTDQGYTWAETLGGFHVAGARGTAGFFVNGANGQNPSDTTATMKVPLNSISEIQVLTTALPAEYGHSAAGTISVVTKTGTNSLHGMGNFFGRTRSMQHRGFFDYYRSSQPLPDGTPPRQSFTLFPDMNLGGPVVIPKIYNGRNKTFFFISYQKFIEKVQLQQTYTTVPTTEMKDGNFNLGGIGQQIYDPGTTRKDANGNWTRDPIAGNIIPPASIDPVAKKVLALSPWYEPNWESSPTSTGPVNNFFYMPRSRSYKPDVSWRLDHQFAPNFKINGGMTYSANAGLRGSTSWDVPLFDATAFGTVPWSSYHWTLGSTWIVSSSTVNEARVSYYRRRNWQTTTTYGLDAGQLLGIPNLPAKSMPQLGTGYGFNVAGPMNNVNENISLRDDLTRISGAHAFKMGYEVMRLRDDQWSIPANVAGNFSFINASGLLANGSAMPRTGNTFAGFLLGYVSSASFGLNLASWLPRDYIHSFYFQDDWKVTPTLTLNLGLRYSNESPFTTKWMQMSQWDPTVIDTVTGKQGGVTHPKSPLNKRDNNNFQPRLGLAWHPLSKWVFRAGFAVNTIDMNFPGGQFEEYTGQASQSMPTGDPRAVYRISQGPNPVVMPVLADGTSPYQGTTYSGRTSSRYDPNLHNPYQLNWNQSIQYELRRNYLMEFSYQGSVGVGLTQNWPLNTLPLDYAKGDPAVNLALNNSFQNYRPYTQFGDVTLRNAKLGHSTYHAGTVTLQMRYATGLNFITFYTFSKALDSAAGGVAPIQNASLNKARADYDRTQRFVGSATYELPFGKGKRFLNRGGIWDKIFGGYQIVWVQTFESGNPLTFGFANSPYLYLPSAMGDRRPNINGTIQLRDNWRDFGGDRFHSANMNSVFTDMSVFSYPSQFGIGNLGRNTTNGPGLRWSQVSAQKSVHLTERLNLDIRWEMNNALHTYNFNNPTTAVDFVNPQTFGKITSDPSLSSWGGPPVMHMTFRLMF